MTDPLSNFPMFRMELNIYPVYNNLHKDLLISHGTLADYPFDSYQSVMFAFAQEALTNESVSLILDSTSPLIVTSLSDLKITTDNIGSNPTFLADEDLKEEIIFTSVTLQRSAFVIGYCLVITVTFCSVFLLYSIDCLGLCTFFIWIGLVTLMICLIMITAVVFGYRQRNEIVVVPIGTVFAFTQLRSTMPGAPDGFGDILDLVGLLPCLVLLAICAVTMVGIYLFADPHDLSRKAFTWEELVNVLCFCIRRIRSTAYAWAQSARRLLRIARRKPSKVIEVPLTHFAGVDIWDEIPAILSSKGTIIPDISYIPIAPGGRDQYVSCNPAPLIPAPKEVTTPLESEKRFGSLTNCKSKRNTRREDDTDFFFALASSS
ncbi:hypothetical protein ARMGADRAFT_1079038 [Armillaria gallica]|uniref:Uncharacterized protein n=1 Tax=Armillaria gallica TaxID=47427 RepID=A0A2H3DJU0_ARMGA|nr:hypothetical protein ARMGADRAFT_1079038 [Armillaria gallica]